MEERRVIVEDVAVLQEARGPGPRDVQVMQLVGVEAVARERDRAEDERKECDERDGVPFAFRAYGSDTMLSIRRCV